VTRRALAALLTVLALAGLALAGCAGERQSPSPSAAGGRPPGPGEVRLLVTRDFGARVLRDVTVPLAAETTVMRLLADQARVETAYGGGFVKAIDGLASTYGGGGEARDWFYWVDGVMADVGAHEYRLRGGETVWWDYHAWAGAMYLPAVVAAFPAPWAGTPLTLATDLPPGPGRAWARAHGLRVAAVTGLERRPAGGLVVASAAGAARTPWLREALAGAGGPRLVAAAPGRLTLLALDGGAGPRARGACLALPDPGGGRPLLVVLVADGGDLADVLAALTPATLQARVGLALVGKELVALPWGAAR